MRSFSNRAASWGELATEGMAPLAEDMQTVVIPGAGHWLAVQAPDGLLAVLTAFLAPYSNGSAAAHDLSQHATAVGAP
jgi:hypothetical protein